MATGLILIDIQNDYFPGGNMELVGVDIAGTNARILLESARIYHIPVSHVQHLSSRPGASFFIPGTQGAEIHPIVRPAPGEEIVTKNFPNSFRGTDLQDTLSRNRVDHLVVCGMMTHLCIDATVRAATDLGFICTLAADACATRDLVWNDKIISAASVHGAFLAALSDLYAEILSTSDILKKGLLSHE
jgi:nicotinamidase-related amidase